MKMRSHKELVLKIKLKQNKNNIQQNHQQNNPTKVCYPVSKQLLNYL